MKKFFLVTGIIVTVILIIFAVLIKLYITPERVKSLVITTAEEHLNRKVHIGEIDVSLFRGIGIKDFALKEADGKSDFISCEDFVLKYQFLPLLSRQVIIEELRLEGPTIHILRDAQGIYNFETIGTKKDEERVERSAPESTARDIPILLVNRFVVNRAFFTIQDSLKKIPDMKSNADVTVSIESAEGSEVVSLGELSMKIQEIKPPAEKAIKNIDASMKFSLRIDMQSERLSIDSMDVAFQDIFLNVKGQVSNFKKSPDINVTMSLPEIEGAKLVSTAQPFVDIKGVKLSGKLTADARLYGNIDRPDALGVEIKLNLNNTGIAVDKFNSIVKGNFDISYGEDRLTIEKADFAIDETAVSLSGNATDLRSSPYVNISMSLPDADTSNLMKTLSPFIRTKGLGLSGRLKADLNLRGRPDKPDTVKASSSIDLNDITVTYDKVSTVVSGDLKLNYQSTTLKITKADMHVNGVAASLKGQIADVGKSPDVDLSFKLPDADASSLLKTISPFIDTDRLNLSGVLKADMDIKGRPESIETLNINGNMVLSKVHVAYDSISGSLDGDINFKKDTASIAVTSAIGNNSMQLNGTVQNLLKNPKADIKVYSKKMIIDDLLALTENEEKTSIQKKGPSPSAPDKEPEALDLKMSVRGEVKVDSALYKGLEMSNFLLNFSFINNKLDITRMSAQAGKGLFNLNSTIDLSKPGYAYKLTSKLDSLHADEVVNTLFPKAKDSIFGILSLNFKMHGAGTLPENMKKNLIADGDFKIVDGKITDTGLSEELASFLNIKELETINLTKAEGTITIRNSIAKLDSIFVSDDLAMDPKGNIGLDKTLDLAFDLKMSPKFSRKALGSDVAPYICRKDEWSQLPLKVKGTLSKPAYTVDLAKVTKCAIKKEADKLLDKLLDTGKDKPQQEGTSPDELAPVRDLIKGLFQ